MNEAFELISACGTLVAIGTSLFLLRQGQQDRRQLREDRRRQQAESVTCWADWTADSPYADFDTAITPAIFIQNASDQAVTQCFVDFRSPSNGEWVRSDVGALAPGAAKVIDVTAPPMEAFEPPALLPKLFFRDSASTWWMRDALGRLRNDPGAGEDGFEGRFATSADAALRIHAARRELS